MIWFVRACCLSLVAGLVALSPTPAGAARAPGPDPGARTAPRCPIAPPVKPAPTRFGLNVDTMDVSFSQALRLRKKRYGAQPVVRTWDNGPPPWNMWRKRTPTLSKRTAVVASFRMSPTSVLAGRYDRSLRHFFRTAPKGHAIYWNYHHEPERHVHDGKFTAAQYRAAFRHIARISGSVCRPNLFPTLVLMGWTADPRANDPWRRYYPGPKYVSVLAWDPYNGRTDVIPKEYRSAARMYGAVVRASAGAHKPWAVAETGSPLIPGDSGARRAAWLTALGKYAKRHRAVWMTYFDFNSRVDFRLRDRPSIASWRALMHPRA